MSTIEVTAPKFDLHGFYQTRARQAVHMTGTEKEKIAILKALINQAYQQGRYDARILTKDNSKWVKS